MVNEGPAGDTHPIDLLLLCARPRIDSATEQQIRLLLKHPRDWADLLPCAQAHSVLPQLHGRLQKLGPQHLPIEIWRAIEGAYQANVRWNLALTGELLKTLALFEQEKIPALTFKGPVLAVQIYGELAARQFLDVDVLVPAGQASTAWRLLEAQGYEPQFHFKPAQKRRWLESRQELTFQHPEKRTSVELHWAVHPAGYSFCPPPDWAWERPERVRLGRQEVATLSREHVLLLLCLHGAKHSWRALGWIADLAMLLEASPGLDWDVLQARVGQFGTRRMWRLGLRLAHELLAAPLPGSVVSDLEQDGESAQQVQAVRQQLRQADRFDVNPVVHDRLYRSTMERSRDRWHYWVDTVLTPTPEEWACLPLPRPLDWLYYPLRAVRVTVKALAIDFGATAKLLSRRR